MKKKNAKSNQTLPMLRRLSVIHSMIKTGKYPNCEDFKDENETSIATTYRDLDNLRYTFSAPLEYDSSKKGFFYTEDYDLPFRNSCNEDYETLMCAKMLLARYEDTPFYDNLSKTLAFMTSSGDEKSSGKFLKRLAVAPRQRTNVSDEMWDTLTAALRENRIVEFDYSGRWNTDLARRRVRPYQLVFDDGFIFLYGFSEERDATRLFLLQRIENLTLTDDAFKLPADFRFEAKCGGGKFGAFTDESRENFKIEFYGESRPYVRDTEWADDQTIAEDKRRGCTVLEFSSCQHYRVLQWILSHGRNAKPVEPESLVAEWREEIRAMAEMAGK